MFCLFCLILIFILCYSEIELEGLEENKYRNKRGKSFLVSFVSLIHQQPLIYQLYQSSFFLNDICQIANLPKLFVMVKRLLNEQTNAYF